MVNKLRGAVIASAAVVALPGVAQAGTTTATSTVTMQVSTQCSVAGATVNLGTFTTTNTWADVGAQLGSMQNGRYYVGSRGFEYANFGTVTCDAGTPYTLFIFGTASVGSNVYIGDGIKFILNDKKVKMWIYIKKIGEIYIADNAAFVGAGARAADKGASATGTGAAQSILGSAPIDLFLGTSTVSPHDRLATPGVYSDTLTYTVNF